MSNRREYEREIFANCSTTADVNGSEGTERSTGQMAPMTDKVADTKEFPKTNDGEQSLVSLWGH